MKTAQTHPLTAEEAHMIESKGTEPAFSGELLDNTDTGTYHCRKCGAHLGHVFEGEHLTEKTYATASTLYRPPLE